jgi:hypothetical protein
MVTQMKRFLPYMLAATLLVSGVSSGLAVEKKQKQTPPVKPTEQPAKPGTAKPADPKGAPKKTVKAAEPEKKYDNFVDQNNNGVDDRRENLKKK